MVLSSLKIARAELAEVRRFMPPSDDSCPLWEDARRAIVKALDDNRDAARVLLDGLKNDRQNRSCPELIQFALTTLEPFPAVRGGVVTALKGICAHCLYVNDKVTEIRKQ